MDVGEMKLREMKNPRKYASVHHTVIRTQDQSYSNPLLYPTKLFVAFRNTFSIAVYISFEIVVYMAYIQKQGERVG